MARPFLSVIIPAFNEEARIISTLDEVSGYLGGQDFTWEVVVVDDGSTDSTAQLAGQWADTHQQVRLISLPHGGKGWAVKHGMLTSTGEYRFMCDADLAMPIQWTKEFLRRMEEGYDIVAGSRQITGARRFDEPVFRHIMGRIFNWSVRFLAVGGFQDTQCGFKCFRGEVADELFELQKTKGFGFDVEILHLALKRGLRVLEMPIDWYHKRASKVRPGLDAFLMLKDVLLVRWRDLSGGYKVPQRRELAGASSAPTVERPGPGPARGTPSPESGGQVVVIVPTYNEAENLPKLVERLFALDIPNSRLIVVDDNSPDGTAQVAMHLAHQLDGRLELITRQGKGGLGTAYVEGFSRALSQGAGYVIQMDADLSHPPEHIPAFLETLRAADVVVGSRYVVGGGVDAGWGLGRRFLSYFANLGIRIVGGLKVKDATSGFKGFRASALRSLELEEFRCRGFGFQTEVAHACQRLGHKVVEYPIVFVDRAHGQSKMSLSIVVEAIWRLLTLRWRRWSRRRVLEDR